MDIDNFISKGKIKEIRFNDETLKVEGWIASHHHDRINTAEVKIGENNYNNFTLKTGLPGPFEDEAKKDEAKEDAGFLNNSGFELQISLSIREYDGLKNSLLYLKPLYDSQPGNTIVAYLEPNRLMPSRNRIDLIGGGDFDEIGLEFLPYFIEYGRLEPHHRVLDIGCGVGRMAVPLTKYLNKKGKYEGFDVHEKCIKWCKKNIAPVYPSFKFRHVKVFNEHYNPDGKKSACAIKFPYKSKSFDFIFLTSVFTHMFLKEVDHYLSEIDRLLRPDGHCLFTAFLLSSESTELMGKTGDAINFKYKRGGYYIAIEDKPEWAVGYDEDSFTEMVNKRFTIDSKFYGKWSGRKKTLSYQDILTVSKP